MLELLKDYKHISDEIKHIKEEIENLKIRSVSPRQSIISDMPRGGVIENDKMAALMIKFEELEQRYNELLTDLLEKQRLVEESIQSLEPLERDIVRYRYIDGLSWYKIQQKTNYSTRTLFRKHGEILEKMEKMAHHVI